MDWGYRNTIFIVIIFISFYIFIRNIFYFAGRIDITVIVFWLNQLNICGIICVLLCISDYRFHNLNRPQGIYFN